MTMQGGGWANYGKEKHLSRPEAVTRYILSRKRFSNFAEVKKKMEEEISLAEISKDPFGWRKSHFMNNKCFPFVVAMSISWRLPLWWLWWQKGLLFLFQMPETMRLQKWLAFWAGLEKTFLGLLCHVRRIPAKILNFLVESHSLAAPIKPQSLTSDKCLLDH